MLLRTAKLGTESSRYGHYRVEWAQPATSTKHRSCRSAIRPGLPCLVFVFRRAADHSDKAQTRRSRNIGTPRFLRRPCSWSRFLSVIYLADLSTCHSSLCVGRVDIRKNMATGFLATGPSHEIELIVSRKFAHGRLRRSIVGVGTCFWSPLATPRRPPSMTRQELALNTVSSIGLAGARRPINVGS